MNDKYDQLKSVIQAANSKRFGLVDPHSAPGSYKYKYPRCGDCFCSIQETHTHYDDTIRLADVLLAMRKTLTTGKFIYNREALITNMPNAWSLEDDNLDHQTEETKQFLIELLTPQTNETTNH